MILSPAQIQTGFVLALFLGVSGVLSGLRSVSRAGWWRGVMQTLGVGLGIILVVVGAISVRVTGWFSGLYILFGVTQVVIFWQRQGSFRFALFVDAIGIALAGAWVAFGPQIGVTLNHRPYPVGPHSAAIAGVIIASGGAVLAFLLRHSCALGHGEQV
jgi:hypothetical protein